MLQSLDRPTTGASWVHFAHDADLGVRGYGSSAESAFEQAALALTAAVTEADVEPRIEVTVHCEAADLELLLVDWLNAVIYQMVTRRMLFGRFRVRIASTRLDGTLWGEPIDVGRHAPAVEPKGATYTALEVTRDTQGRWTAACIIDV